MTAQIGVRIGRDATARVLSHEGRAVRLEIDTATGETVTVWASGNEVTTPADVGFARMLVEAADRFLAACERACVRPYGSDTER